MYRARTRSRQRTTQLGSLHLLARPSAQGASEHAATSPMSTQQPTPDGLAALTREMRKAARKAAKKAARKAADRAVDEYVERHLPELLSQVSLGGEFAALPIQPATPDPNGQAPEPVVKANRLPSHEGPGNPLFKTWPSFVDELQRCEAAIRSREKGRTVKLTRKAVAAPTNYSWDSVKRAMIDYELDPATDWPPSTWDRNEPRVRKPRPKRKTSKTSDMLLFALPEPQA